MKSGLSRKHHLIRTTSASLLPLYLLSTLLSTMPAWAVLDNTMNPDAINAGAITPEKLSCDDFCTQLVSAKSGGASGSNHLNGHLHNTRGTVGWSGEDD